MNLHRLLQQRAIARKPVRVGLIGAGKFGSMFLNQVPTMAGLEVSSGAEACADPEVEVIVEATGSPPAGIAHARAAIASGRHIVMVNVEADVLAGPLLAEEARARAVVYSLAY